MLGYVPGRLISPHSAEARERASTEEDIFQPWDENQPYPSSSIPAQVAAKCALIQGNEVFERYHEAIFKAFFQDCRDISNTEVLSGLALDSGLDIKRFRVDSTSGSHEPEVLAEYEEARTEFEGRGIPLALIGGRYPLGGAVPVEMYYRAVDLCLTGK